jgi:two-component system, sensor histidine kinase and response regulator
MTLLTCPTPAGNPSQLLLLQRLARGERRKTRVLLIEDDMAIALMYQLQLANDGYDVELANDGVSGLRRLQEDPPDLVLLDIRLPRLPGLDVLRAIAVDPSVAGVPVLILSNYGEPAVVREGLQLGARDYLIKSQTTPIQLSMRLREYLPPETSA